MQKSIQIQKVPEEEKSKYWELLLLADESSQMIETYIHCGDVFVLLEDTALRSIAVVTDEGDGIFELKNLATVPAFQKQGFGRQLVAYIISKYRPVGKVLQVGTGRFTRTVEFYKKCGFVESHIIENFYLEHYDHPIIEEGVRLTDMQYLKLFL